MFVSVFLVPLDHAGELIGLGDLNSESSTILEQQRSHTKLTLGKLLGSEHLQISESYNLIY